ncbi:acyltransferase family protein [Bacillus sp. NTK071]|uniref:acyltransferase family protein n=1 Tax=Bacillus sp. NTK071 TaxID=2802175 RepID=UPI001A90638A|nr:acyltransferase family protein [Bacillus sp. NTK071]MBN8209811.1 acyltransferase family protein [Bacillus sp. NTK071]
MDHSTITRQHDLDWIKVIATLGVFLYHCSMFFNPFPWHVKNNVVDSSSILVFSLFVGAWIMPVFFAVSGISMTYTMKKRGFSEFGQERMKRLGIPLLFGVFTLTPPQIYIERMANLQFQGSFLAFMPHYFEGVYLDFGGTGNFAFFGLHLWYLLVLLVFSFLTFPLFKRIKGSKNVSYLHVGMLPLILFLSGFVHTQRLGGWDLVFYFIVFVYGYYFFSSSAFKLILHSTIPFYLIVAMVTSVIYIVWFMAAYPEEGSVMGIVFYGVRTINCWSLLVSIFYLASKYLSFSNRFQTYGSEASLPFYILHQPVIVLLGYVIRDLQWPILVKFIFLSVVSFIIIVNCYHFVIRQSRMLRVLLGLKSKNRIMERSGVQTDHV